MEEKKERKNDKVGAAEKEASKEEKKIATDIKKEIVIHSMPRRFFKVAPVTKQSKGVGVLIIVGGGVVLLGMVAIVYFFVFKKPSAESTVVEEPSVVEDVVVTDNLDDKRNEKEEEVVDDSNKIKPEEEKDVVVVEEDPETDEVSSSTEENLNKATSSKKIIDAKIIEPVASLLKDAIDSDNDGLFDEEEAIFLTNGVVKDSDGDGYEDLAELMNLYNPAGEGALMVNDNIEKYINSQYAYSFYYPKNWEIDNIDGDTSVIFKAANNQFVQIIVQANNEKQSLEDWYKDQFSVIRIDQQQKIYKKGWLAIESADGLSTYLMNSSSSNIFVMTYSIGLDSTLYYKNVYKMMIKSMEVEK